VIEINLIPDVKQELIKAQRVRAAVISVSIIVSIVAVAVVAVLSMYVFAFQTVRQSNADKAIETGYKTLQDNEDLSKVLTIQNQLTKISTLNDAKSINSRVYDLLANIIPPAPNQIKISELTVDNLNTSITIQGQAVNSYQALEVFKKTVSGTMIEFADGDGTAKIPAASEISTTDVNYGEDSTNTKVLRFTLTFKYPPELLAPATKNLIIVPAEKGNATDSYLALPQSLFENRARDLEAGNE